MIEGNHLDDQCKNENVQLAIYKSEHGESYAVTFVGQSLSFDQMKMELDP